MSDAEIAHELGTIEAALTASFPTLAVAPLRELERGFGSIVVETPSGVVFRVARQARTAAGHSKEMALLPALASRLPVLVPNPEWRVEPGSHGLAYGAIGYRRLDGEELTPGPRASRAAARLAGEIADVLVALHRFPIEEAERLGLPRGDRDRAEFDDLCRRVLPVLNERLSPVEFGAVVRWAERMAADTELDDFEPTVRHGDLWYGNLLVDPAENRLVAVLDWENAAIGDRAWDFARQLHLGEAFCEAVLREYERRGGAVDDRLRHRVERRWELLEFAGIPAAAELDQAELEETIEKLRRGPILASIPRAMPL